MRAAESWLEAAAGDVMVRYLVSGKGPPLVLLHGLSGSTRWWSRNIEALSRDFRVHLVDLVQMRRPAAHPRPALEDSSHQLAAWMKAVGLERAFIAGHSMGGHIAAELAADFPDQVERLVLVNPAILFHGSPVKRAISHLLRAAPPIPIGLMPLLVQDAWRAGPRMLWQATRELLQRDLRTKLRTIETPTLLVWGTRDGILPLTVAEEIGSLLPQCQLRLMTNAGHNPMWEQPDAFNAEVRAFLAP